MNRFCVFMQKFKMAGNLFFGQKVVDDCAYTFHIQNFVEIALSRPFLR